MIAAVFSLGSLVNWNFFFWLIGLIYPVTIVFIIILILLENRDPIKTLAWILVLVLLPFIGIILYLFFGRNFRKRKTFSKKAESDYAQIHNLQGLNLLNLEQQNFYNDPKIKDKSNIITLLLNNSKALLTEKNEVNVLTNGAETFPAIFQALKKAEDHIHLEFYIIEDDQIGNKIREILEEKAKNGIKVRVIYDGVGSWQLNRRYIKSLQKAGVEIHPFRPVNFPFLTSKLNYRNHRKIIVVDGKTGFLGGLNISDKYLYGDKKLGFWRDTHLQLKGDAVKSLQTVFLTDWYFVSNQILNQKSLFPEVEIEGRKLAQIVAGGPDSEWSSIMQAYFSAIATAKEYIFISTPYFTPNRSILTALKTAALSGIDVRLILPGNSDSWIIKWCSFSYIEELLNAGVRVFIYQNGFTHSKIMIVDGVFGSIGSANMDIRSFDQNLEINALIYDREIMINLKNSFYNDLSNSYELTPENYQKRPLNQKFKESFARIFSPIL